MADTHGQRKAASDLQFPGLWQIAHYFPSWAVPGWDGPVSELTDQTASDSLLTLPCEHAWLFT